MQKTNLKPLDLSQIYSDSTGHISVWILILSLKSFDMFTFLIKAYIHLDNRNVQCPTGDFWFLECFITNRQETLWTLTVMWTKTRRWLLYLDNLFLTGKTISLMKKLSKPTQFRCYGYCMMAFSRNTHLFYLYISSVQ